MTELQQSSHTMERDENRSPFGEWLPTFTQMKKAVKLQFERPKVQPVDQSGTRPSEDAEDIGEEDVQIRSDSVLYASMRQGMGMIIVAGLVAGLLPFIWNWITAGRDGTVVPLSNFAQFTRSLPTQNLVDGNSTLTDMLQQIAGLPPWFVPGWLAAGVSSLGLWINVPLQWLTIWIVYGLLVLVIAKLLGAQTTLQQFYIVTSFSFLPLVLTFLSPVPCLGPIVSLLAIVWAIAIYTVAVRTVTGFSTALAFLCTILPSIVLLFIAIIASVAVAVTTIGLFL